MLKGKRIILGISGSIAAYKSAELCRLLVKAGAEVQVLMTKDAAQFITPLTLSTLSKKPVFTDFVKNNQGEWVNHVELGLWADLLLIAPATATTLSRMATGFADNLLTAVHLSARCPVALAPAMDLDMWLSPANQRNVKQLLADGVHLIEPTEGELASGLSGKGRMAEPEDIVQCVNKLSNPVKQTFAGKKVLLTVGPTQESLDPVRFISNHSTGKMGFAIARELKKRGAEVVLVVGPVSEPIPTEGFLIHEVVSAHDMAKAAKQLAEEADIVILSAAVADYRPATYSPAKIKKQGDYMEIRLEKTEDIAKSLGENKRENQVLVGFALETNNEEENAYQKLLNKNLDFIVLNSLNDKQAGFAHDTNKITIIDRENKQVALPLLSKSDAASGLLDFLAEKLKFVYA